MNTKINKKISAGFLTFLLLCTFACTEKFDELNNRPDQVNTKDLNASLLGQSLASSQYNGMFGHANWQVAQNLYADLYAQYYATIVTSFNSDQFNEQSSWTNSMWRDFYSRGALPLFSVEKYSAENGMPIENAIAKIWKVQIYHRMTDYFGPIIYSQYGNAQLSVSYDSQEAIYKDFFKTLDEATAVLSKNQGGSAFASSDLLYNGKINQWITFANSLRLRLAIRLAYVNPALAKQEAEKAVAAGVIVNNSDNANVLATDNSINAMSTVEGFGEFRMSATMQSVLTGFDDPRLSEFFNERVIGGGYIGVRNGLPNVEKTLARGYYSSIDTRWHVKSLGGTNPPLKVMCASEVYFLRAEGALRGWNMAGTANEFYNLGITRSLSEWTSASPAQISAYINSTKTPIAINDKWNTPAMSDIPVLYQTGASFEKRLEQIITQKWIALFPDGWEAWSERRRTGYPVGYPIIESVNPEIPKTGSMKRLTFVTSEIASNNQAVIAARGLLNGPDKNTTKLWWDAR